MTFPDGAVLEGVHCLAVCRGRRGVSNASQIRQHALPISTDSMFDGRGPPLPALLAVKVADENVAACQHQCLTVPQYVQQRQSSLERDITQLRQQSTTAHCTDSALQYKYK